MFSKAYSSALAFREIRRSLSTRSKADKVYPNCAAALEGLNDGMTVLFGGFGVCGIPENLIEAIVKKQTKNIVAVSNECGTANFGLGLLVNDGQIKVLHASYVGENKSVPEFMKRGELELHLTPQGSLAEKLRAGGAGIPAFWTPAGANTVVETGYPVKYKADGSGDVEKYSEPKETRIFNGRKHVLEESFHGDFACIKGWKADRAGNVVFRSTAQNFNPDCAKAAKISVVEVEEIVEVGELHPDEIHLPGIYVDRIVREDVLEKRIERMRNQIPGDVEGTVPSEGSELTIRDHIAKRAALELRDGMYVNLGVGEKPLSVSRG
jgi:3-oxoacid CoA-transferase